MQIRLHPGVGPDPDRFDPNRFDPARWLPQRAAAVPRTAFFPFGAGAGKCGGERSRLVEAYGQRRRGGPEHRSDGAGHSPSHH
ncbi:cytochrome P450 [Streptomyces sp. NPDC002577]